MANMTACAGCTAEGKARQGPGWERAEGQKWESQPGVSGLAIGWDSITSDMHRAAVAAPSCR